MAGSSTWRSWQRFCDVTSSTYVRKQFVIIPKVKPNLKSSEVNAFLESHFCEAVCWIPFLACGI